MTQEDDRQGSEGGPYLRIAEQAFRVVQQTERVAREARAAQRSAADSIDRSADSHDRTAKSYEELAKLSPVGNEYATHAARHREFAQEDCQMAERLRQMADRRTSHASGHAVQPD